MGIYDYGGHPTWARHRVTRGTLSHDLVGCFVATGPNEISDLLGINYPRPTGLTTFYSASGTWRDNEDGMAVGSTSAITTERFTLGLLEANENPIALSSNIRPARTVCWWAIRESATDFQRIFDKSSGASALNGYVHIYGDSAASYAPRLVDTVTLRLESGVASVANTYEFWACTWRTGSSTSGNQDNQYYKDGFPVATTVHSAPQRPSNVDTQAALLQWNHTDTNRKFGGRFFAFAAWYRALDQSEIMAIYQGQLFDQSPIYVLSSVATIKSTVYRSAVMGGAP